MQNTTPLLAISPLDGRYNAQVSELSTYFSEFALFKNRLHIEVEYLLALASLGLQQIAPLPDPALLRGWVTNFSIDDALAIKAYERTTNHDIKALEYFIHAKLDLAGYGNYNGWVHFGLTSQDINNTAIPISLKNFVNRVYIPLCQSFISELDTFARQWQHVPMLARTHGQPASPTKLGKEIAVFEVRLQKQLNQLAAFTWEGKFGGATGNFNAHKVAFSHIDWIEFAKQLLNTLGLERQILTTQIEHYDSLAELFNIIARINTIITDFSRDMWGYISLNYFKLTLKPGEVGSSAMPHKVNPIDFENAEGNLGLANAVFAHLAAKLPVSRWQRDLSDSTVLRSLGVPFGHSVLALKSAMNGLQKCTPNLSAIQDDLINNAVVVAEAYQVILRREGVADGYERIKELTRINYKPSLADMQSIIDTLPVSEAVKQELRAITPESYTGYGYPA